MKLKKIIILNKVDYYTTWEDFELIHQALEINSNDVVFSITSGGCNIFNILLLNPKKIIAVDYNPYQSYLLELKINAIKNLEYIEFLQFIGVTQTNNRFEVYEKFRDKLSENARHFWDLNSYAINKGLLRVGEQDVKNFGRFLRFFKGKKVIEDFFTCETIEKQTDYFYKFIYGLPWKITQFFRSNKYFMRFKLYYRMLFDNLYGIKRSSEFFRYIQKIEYPRDHLKKIEEIFTKIPIKNNNFLSLMLLGYYFNENSYPPYLKKENYNILKQRIHKIEIKTASVYDEFKKFPNDIITKYNLSNIFDWIDDVSFKNYLFEIIRTGKNKGKVFYSMTRNDRTISKDIKEILPNKELSIKLLKEDRTFLYSGFEIGEICK